MPDRVGPDGRWYGVEDHSVVRPRRARRLTQGAESTRTEVVPCCIERVTAVDPIPRDWIEEWWCGSPTRSRGLSLRCTREPFAVVPEPAWLPGYRRLAPTLAFERRLGPDGQPERSRCSRDGCRSRSGSRARPHTEQPAAKGVT